MAMPEETPRYKKANIETMNFFIANTKLGYLFCDNMTFAGILVIDVSD